MLFWILHFQNMRELADTPARPGGFRARRVGLGRLRADAFTRSCSAGTQRSAEIDRLTRSDPCEAGLIHPSVCNTSALWEAMDVSDLLAQVHQPTLVLRLDPYVVPARCCQRVAAKIPGAQFRAVLGPNLRAVGRTDTRFRGPPSPPGRARPLRPRFAQSCSPTSSATPR